MVNLFAKKINRYLDKLIAYKGIDKETLLFKKTYWSFIFLVAFYVLIMTTIVYIYDIPALFLYGVLLLIMYIPLLFVFPLIRRKMVWLVHVLQHLAIFITYFCVIKIGGITYSGGIFIAALSAVVFSIMYHSVAWSIWYFTLFFLCTLGAFFAQSLLKIPPGISPEMNDLIFLINTLSISGLILAVVLTYLYQDTQREIEKAERFKEIDKIKSKFYTNITHEFRTPISVILGATDQIESKNFKSLSGITEKIKRNSNSLLSLVNQMLDLSKLEAKVMPLHYVQGDVIRFIRYLAESFEFLARNKELSFHFKCSSNSYEMDYDPEKLTQIISNVLGNAIKFTPEKGKINLTVIIDEENHKLIITVSDTGVGISPDKINRVFDRFYQDESSGEATIEGSGLGLSITKELVHLIQGEISVESKFGKGTTFKVVLPITKSAPLESQPEQKWIQEFTPEKQVKSKSKIKVKPADEIPSVLIVEDNADVLDYICSLLENEYQLSTAKNGIEGLANAVRIIPDIIISDIMMPEMDGIEMVKQLKADIRTSHIPVIMLTAIADMKSKIEGFSEGAEAYLTKPFNKEELFIRIKALIQLRKELQQKYAVPGISFSSKQSDQTREDSFMKRINEFFNQNIDNEEVAISDICEAMHMSRSQLYRKFRALTNRSVNDYFRSFRLHRAKQLLQTSDFNVTQVAFEVGFKNLSHFSKSFVKEFGFAPSQLKKKES
jgi:signal transduction histidine kinase/DNA-binding response OmpR family regulator